MQNTNGNVAFKYALSVLAVSLAAYLFVRILSNNQETNDATEWNQAHSLSEPAPQSDQR